MGKIIGMLERVGRSVSGALGADTSQSWTTVWFRPRLGLRWQFAGWLTGGGVIFGSAHCELLRTVAPHEVGKNAGGYCGGDSYNALRPGQFALPLLGPRYFYTYRRYRPSSEWLFSGWLWSTDSIVATLKTLDPQHLYIGG